MQKQDVDLTITEFADRANNTWMIINDGVMGGISKSRIEVTDDKVAVFSGYLSLENNGGFASTRMTLDRLSLQNYTGIKIKVKGDGRSYQFRLRTDDRFDGISYRSIFRTEKETWQVLELPFKAFKPTYRGRILTNVPPLQPGKIKQLGFLLADKSQGNFELRIDWIKAYCDNHPVESP